MNNPLLTTESTRWNKIRRRWTVVLGVLMTINGGVVWLAVAGYANRPLVADGADGTIAANETTAAGTDRAGEAGSALAGNPASVADTTLDATPLNVATEMPALTECPLESIVTTPSESAWPVGGEPHGIGAVCPESVTRETVTQETVTHETITPEVATQDGAPREIEKPALLIANPAENGGVVHFLVDDTVYSLEAGEYLELTPKASRIVFHRGDELDDCQRELAAGVLRFHVDADGWQLLECTGVEAPRVVAGCRKLTGL